MSRKGETREKILNAAAKAFFKNGFEATSVKMILEEAGVVTGSFYHFFPSKEKLFECVVEAFLQDYTQRVSTLLSDDSLDHDARLHLFMCEIQSASKTYFDVLEGNRLHWTIQHALHNKTMETLIDPVSRLLEREIAAGRIESKLDVDAVTLAAILIRGMEAIFHAHAENGPETYASDTAEEHIRAYIRLLLTFHSD